MLHHASHKFIASIAAAIVALIAFTGSAWAAAVEVNSADASQLESIKGIGPALSGKIMTARKTGAFKDWSDFETRVSGVGDRNAAGFSRAGLTVAGHAKEGAQAAADGTTAKGAGAKTASKKSAADGGATTLVSSAKK